MIVHMKGLMMRPWCLTLALLTMTIGASIVGAAAHPLAAAMQTQQTSDVVQIRHGCGKGWRRNSHGQCVRDEVRPGFRWSSRSGWGPKCRYVKTPHGGSRRVCQ